MSNEKEQPKESANPQNLGRQLALFGASKGGKARAASLTPAQRSEAARYAVEARWERAGKLKGVTLRATHGSSDHPLKIGDIEIPCFVLEGGKRVLHQRGMVTALGMARGSSGGTGGDRLAKFVSGDRLKDFVQDKLREVTENPIKFITPDGLLAYGYEATVLADICEAVLEARKAGLLQKQQEHIAAQCEILVRGFARVGIIALVDEATGYQDARARDALAKILEAFVAKELRKWVRTFPPDFYKELFRLKNLKYPPEKNPPQYIGTLTNSIIYDRLAPGVRAELKSRNPANERGNRRARHHQWLTADIGHPKLLQHLSAVIALMRVCSNGDYDGFIELLDRALPKYTETPLFPSLQGQI